jgi:hypothetical protein
MAAVLFRREPLTAVSFRWEEEKCECRCCCDDLRAAGKAIGYLEGAVAWHRPFVAPLSSAKAESTLTSPPQSAAQSAPARVSGRILAAFDRRDHVRFRTQFLATLRDSGNQEPVWAFAYGLYPSEVDRLAAQPGVTVLAFPGSPVCPALRRLKDFQRVIAGWPAETPVAYWDAGDIFFQDRLGALWDLVAAFPGVLLVTEEPKSYADNPVIRTWSDWIVDPEARQRAFEIMSTHVFLNSGFAAGTASALLNYFREGDRLLNSSALHGVGDWGDQPALNLYCHANPGSWRAIHSGWNYTVAGRDDAEHWIALDGRATRLDGRPIHVLHGNSGFLRWLELSPWGPSAKSGPTPPLAPRG